MEKQINHLKGYKSVKDFYFINSDGYIINKTTNKILSLNGHRYLQTILYTQDGVRKNVQLHRLLALAFIPNLEDKPFVNHKDEDIRNNDLSNLEWASAKENVNHGSALQRRSSNQRNQASTSRAIKKNIVATGEEIVYESVMEACRNGHDSSTIYKCLKGFKKTHKGGKWAYA